MNTSPPAISGKPQQGATLTATPGTWTRAGATFKYAWSDGATGSTDKLSAADAGKTISVTVTATDATGSAKATSAPVGPVTAPPANTSAPTISGSARQGSTLTANPGGWTGTPAPTFTYLWSNGATGSTAILSPADAGKAISILVTATNAVGSATASSAGVGPVAAPPVNTSPPKISGTTQQDAKLTADPGKWVGFPAPTFTYLWSDNVTGQTRTLTAADVGKTLSVTVTATNSAGTATATSASVGPVTAKAGPPGDKPPGNSGGDNSGGGNSGGDNSGHGGSGTATTIVTSPTAAVTNQAVVLIATVTSSGGEVPSGAVAFNNGAATISGCASVPVQSSGESVTVSCQASFPASTAQLTAVFTASRGSKDASSASGPDRLSIGPDSSSTALDVSGTADIGKSTTYTATVTPPASRPGPIRPSGLVEFFDHGQPIASCIKQALANGGATCTLSYAATGTHSITAQYLGDGNFTGSTSPPGAVNVVVPRARGAITSTMQWTFYYTPTYTTVRALVVNGVSGATVAVRCHGRGCPFGARTTTDTKPKRCGGKRKRTCAPPATMDLAAGFRKRRLQVGTAITITITRPGWIGKNYVFTVQPRRGPRVQIGCLAPGGTRPGVGC